jgi:hypothetical protein
MPKMPNMQQQSRGHSHNVPSETVQASVDEAIRHRCRAAEKHCVQSLYDEQK